MLNEASQQNKDTNKKLKETNMKLKETNMKLQETVRLQRETIEEKQQENNMKEIEINEMKTELTTIRQQHIAELVQTKKTNQQLTKERDELRTELRNLQTTPKAPRTIELFIDSNRKVIEPALKKITNHRIETHLDMYTVKHLHDKAQENPDLLKTDTTKIIMLGTNDVRKDHHSEAIKQLEDIAKQTNQEQTIVLNIPPPST